VFLLGAGASAASDFRLPVMSGFFGHQPVDLPSSLRGQSFEKLTEFVRRLYGGRARRDWNVEEVLTSFEISEQMVSAWSPSGIGLQEIRELRQLLLVFLHTRLAAGVPEDRPCALHRYLAEILGPDDSVVTLNYDLIMDWILTKHAPNDTARKKFDEWKQVLRGGVDRPGDPSDRQPITRMEESPGCYLKLHGSLDVFDCPTLGCPARGVLQRFDLGEHSFGGLDLSPCQGCGGDRQPFILAPGPYKHQNMRLHMAAIWRRAYHELQYADEIHVIGVSLAPSDVELQWLLRSTRRRHVRHQGPRVVTVNPDPAVIRRMTVLFPRSKVRASWVRQFDRGYVKTLIRA
jgi:hypothetical protein